MLLGDMILQFTFIFKLLIKVVTLIYIFSFQHVEFLVMIQQSRCTFKFLATDITFKHPICIIAFFIRSAFNFPNFFINGLTLLSFKKGFVSLLRVESLYSMSLNLIPKPEVIICRVKCLTFNLSSVI